MKHYKNNKNNTCAGCGSHIDKSRADSYWVTLQRSSFFFGDEPTEVKGWRKTYCAACASRIMTAAEAIEEDKRVREELAQQAPRCDMCGDILKVTATETYCPNDACQAGHHEVEE